MKFLILLILSLTYIKADNWAVLVAGSKDFYNYRHQSDICHAYQILHENEIPDENIIVMMYDDIAFNPDNPFQGIILNKPNGSNVYENVPKDYTGENVTPKNFLAILRGDQLNATGRVLNTGPDDNIFVYFSDHGGTGLIAFPNEYLYAHELINTLEYMYQNNKYKNMVIYVEACESGSMFDGLLDSGMNIYVTTAANPNQSSYACYWDNIVKVYLGDVYSVNFLENSDSFENDWNETLQIQYNIIEQETNTSVVCQYGDLNMSDLPLRDFLIFQNITTKLKNKKIKNNTYNFNVIDSRDVKIDTMMREYIMSPNTKKKELMNLIQNEFLERHFYDSMFKNKYQEIKKNDDDNSCYSSKYIDTKCLKESVELFEFLFGSLSDYGLKYLKVLAEPCMVDKSFKK